MPTSILIIEDHALLRQTLHDWLRISLPACCVRTAGSSEEVGALTQPEPPQIVIMDVGLARIAGFEAVRQVRGKSAAVHIVVLTSDDAASYRAEAEAAGASAYVPKHQLHRRLLPVLQELLAERVRLDDEVTDGECGDPTAAGDGPGNCTGSDPRIQEVGAAREHFATNPQEFPDS